MAAMAMARARYSSLFRLLLVLAIACRGITWLGTSPGRSTGRPGLRRLAEPERSSYESSPGWTKSVVNGCLDGLGECLMSWITFDIIYDIILLVV